MKTKIVVVAVLISFLLFIPAVYASGTSDEVIYYAADGKT